MSQAVRALSSALLQISVSSTEKKKSFMNKLIGRGPRTEPCGTSLRNSDHELKEKSTFVCCYLLDKYDLMRLSALLSKPLAIITS